MERFKDTEQECKENGKRMLQAHGEHLLDFCVTTISGPFYEGDVWRLRQRCSYSICWEIKHWILFCLSIHLPHPSCLSLHPCFTNSTNNTYTFSWKVHTNTLIASGSSLWPSVKRTHSEFVPWKFSNMLILKLLSGCRFHMLPHVTGFVKLHNSILTLLF